METQRLRWAGRNGMTLGYCTWVFYHSNSNGTRTSNISRAIPPRPDQ
ncbi:mCG147812 [Mus musculus]|nr:mCG147812 [Mus musculus]